MLSITQILIIFPIIQRLSCTEDLYRDAERIADYKRREYARLKELYYVAPTDYDAAFNIERSSPSLENIKAQNLVEYQLLFKQKEDKHFCKRRTFQECVNESAKVAAENKCLPLLGKCDRNAKYAPIGGYCNNLKHPNNGRANSPYVHLLDADYDDDISTIRKTTSNKDLPSPRLIGNVLDNQYVPVNAAEDTNNMMGLMFGQLVVHDVSNRKVYSINGNNSPGARCCKKEYEGPLNQDQMNPNCLAVEIPSNDPFFAESGIRCQNYLRMMPTLAIDCKINYLVENEIAAYFDLTIIYSDSEDLSNFLRTRSNGQLKIDSLNILPEDSSGGFIAGDRRVRQTPMLAVLHSLFYRFHNKVAESLAAVNKRWNDDRLFFESRRIVIAIYQKIVYEDWLPLFIGKDLCMSYSLICDKMRGTCSKYDIDIDPSVTVEFAHNAFRSYHKNIPTNVTFVKANYKEIYKLSMSDALGRTEILKENDKYDDLVRGMLEASMIVNQPGYTNELRNKMTKVQYKGREMGNDLHLIDTMRCRDSGTAPFVKYFERVYKSKKMTSWRDLQPYFNELEFKLLRKLYNGVEDIDLLTGLLLERHRKNEVGPIGGAIIANQFYRLKYGDRFFYSNPNNPYTFEPDQLQQIKDYTFAKLLCFVTDVIKVPRNAFVSPSKNNPNVLCQYLEQLNFNLFKAWN